MRLPLRSWVNRLLFSLYSGLVKLLRPWGYVKVKPHTRLCNSVGQSATLIRWKSVVQIHPEAPLIGFKPIFISFHMDLGMSSTNNCPLYIALVEQWQLTSLISSRRRSNRTRASIETYSANTTTCSEFSSPGRAIVCQTMGRWFESNNLQSISVSCELKLAKWAGGIQGWYT